MRNFLILLLTLIFLSGCVRISRFVNQGLQIGSKTKHIDTIEFLLLIDDSPVGDQKK
jgi:uncharacterized protein YceK